MVKGMILWLMPVMGYTASMAPEQTLRQAWQQSAGGTHIAATATELDRARSLFARSLRDPAASALPAQWRELGFDWQRQRIGERVIWILREREGHRRGRGFYLFTNAHGAAAPVIQAPHRFFDRHTGRLALDWFLAGGFRAAAWNSVHRYRGADDHEPDLAHLESSYLTAFQRALGALPEDMPVYQLHGFASDKRKSETARQADWIISSAREWPGPAATRLADCLGRWTDTRARLYPVQVSALGGTTNTTATALREAGGSQFVHVEMDAALRQRLLDSAGLRRDVHTCLLR